MKQQIEELKAEIAELKMKVSLLEARPMVITVAPSLPVPASPWPSYPQPYMGDNPLPITWNGNLGINSQTNVMMSAQSSDRLQ